MNVDPGTSPNNPRRLQATVMVLTGVSLGLAIGVLLYVWLDPLIEGRDDALEEFQGLLFNIVPAGAVLGGLFSWWLYRRLRMRP